MDAATAKKSRDLKIKLMKIIKKHLNKESLGQRSKVEMVGVSQPQISALNRLQSKGFSVERLLRILVKLDKCVTITIDDVQLTY